MLYSIPPLSVSLGTTVFSRSTRTRFGFGTPPNMLNSQFMRAHDIMQILRLAVSTPKFSAATENDRDHKHPPDLIQNVCEKRLEDCGVSLSLLAEPSFEAPSKLHFLERTNSKD